jgi:hypothetical protein
MFVLEGMFECGHQLVQKFQPSCSQLALEKWVLVLSNAILPARPGDIIRAVLLRQVFGISFSYGFAGIVVERLFDVLAVCSLGVIASFTVALPPLVLAGLYSLSTVGLGLVTASVVLTWRYASIWKLAGRFLWLFRYFFVRFLFEWLQRFASALRILYSAARMSKSVLLTSLGWGTLVLSFMILLNAFQLPISPAAACAHVDQSWSGDTIVPRSTRYLSFHGSGRAIGLAR